MSFWKRLFGGEKDVQTTWKERIHLPGKPPELFTPKEMTQELKGLRGKRIYIDYQSGIDGPQTAARLIRETLQSVGVVLTQSKEDAEAFVWIQAGSQYMRFTFVVGDLFNKQRRICNECGPRELTAAIMTAVCIFFKSRKEDRTSQLPTTTLQLISSLDTKKGEELQQVENELVQLGDRAMDSISASINELNRSLTASAFTMDSQKSVLFMESLGRRIKVLGKMRNWRGIEAILDALGDSATGSTISHTQIRSQLKSLSEIAIDALVNVGPPAIPSIIAALGDGRPSVRSTLVTVLGRIGGHEAKKALQNMLNDPDGSVRKKTKEALSLIH